LSIPLRRSTAGRSGEAGIGRGVCFGPRLRPATQRSRRAYPLFHRRPFREPWTILDKARAGSAGGRHEADVEAWRPPARHARGQEAPAAGMKSEPGPPITLGNAAAARVRLIVCCLDWRHQVEPDPAETAGRYGAETTVPDWRERLVCSQCRICGSPAPPLARSEVFAELKWEKRCPTSDTARIRSNSRCITRFRRKTIPYQRPMLNSLDSPSATKPL
jgi:hypothetical protein